MPSSLRRFIGMVFLVTFVVVYCFVAMVIGDITMQGKHWALQFVFFAIAGLIWTVPAAFIIKWMYKTTDTQQ
ncbi:MULTISPECIES: DUF2842 domain-containing protein [Pseudovibrio]|uniref:DUF2842 domain-containing protein n=1 Tax=Stappiaceae TaxID=2821832 RepID=UPI0023654C39|nr:MULTISPECIES: DUF2842 domain-containing protein [Pseudovibrio]MDD7908412.1 DUF2842 domain-containing protein [Pseudovibrio exalbescens]MDX5592613.1 DUF2842 domain-containing protein [Pseudovibrio sp. SPO723]